MILDDRQLIVLDDERVKDVQRHTPDECLIVLDELHLWFNARDWSQNGNTFREMINFLSQSRKYQNDLIFITQSEMKMDKQFRTDAAEIWRFRDLSQFRLPGIGIHWPLQQIVQIQYDYDRKTVCERRYIWKSQKIFDLYDTNVKYQTGYPRLQLDSRGKPVRINQPTKKDRMIKLTLIALALVVSGVLAWKFFHRENPLNPMQVVTSPGSPAPGERASQDRHTDSPGQILGKSSEPPPPPPYTVATLSGGMTGIWASFKSRAMHMVNLDGIGNIMVGTYTQWGRVVWMQTGQAICKDGDKQARIFWDEGHLYE
jgi:hypothetical protein